MISNRRLLVLPGDGIGPEVIRESLRVIEWLDKRRVATFGLVEQPLGGAAYDKYGAPLTDETLAIAQKSDAVLFGAVGGPKWENLPYDMRPERGLLRLRKEMDLFANLRPAFAFEPLIGASTLKPEIIRGVDMVIVRELTGGVYFGTPRGILTQVDGSRRGVNTHVYTTPEIIRVGRVAFELARKRKRRIISVDKSNVMEAGMLWREEIQKLRNSEYKDVDLTHMYADNCAMQIVRNPRQFDVVVTDNLFGDVLSDCAAMCTGSLGMLPSASLGEADVSGHRKALYEPIHGSAPDIAGKNVANPLACILSVAMMMRHSFGMDEAGEMIERAVRGILARGVRTEDIAEPGATTVSTSGMGDAILGELERVASS